MILLSIDTSGPACSAALLADDRLLGEIVINSALTHSETIMPAVDELLSKIVVTPDSDERAKMVYDVQALIHEDCPMIYLASQYSIIGASASLRGFVMHPNSMHDFTTCYFE